ncbi:MAG: diaminopimelate decarboxylase [Deltaproteobacteria bacterium]|nr:diaminopimelate decarboxylase [Deltaproteobacteria bacterium]
MHDFHYRGRSLFCEDFKVGDAAAKFGTPLYVYSRKTVSDHYNKIDAAFSDIPHRIFYSVKANASAGVLHTIASLGGGADIVSGGELFRAMRAGIPAGRVVYSGVGKTDDEIRFAINEGIFMFNVESEMEMGVLNEIAGSCGKIARAAYRVNPDVDPHTHEYITTGKEENKFGIPFTTAGRLYNEARKLKNVAICGIDFHIGSQILNPEPYVLAIREVRELLRGLRSDGIEIKYFNIGGGLGIIYDDEKPATAKEFRDHVGDLVKELGVTLLMEPGRFIVGNAGILVTKVLYLKNSSSKKFVVVDAGMNDLIRPALYGAFHKIQPCELTTGEEITADIVGPICESGDFLGLKRTIPSVKRGDLLAVMSAGAYGLSMSSNYNSRPRAAEVLVSGEEIRLVRERENYGDIVAKEIL